LANGDVRLALAFAGINFDQFLKRQNDDTGDESALPLYLSRFTLVEGDGGRSVVGTVWWLQFYKPN
jgi:hypothetical protein